MTAPDSPSLEPAGVRPRVLLLVEDSQFRRLVHTMLGMDFEVEATATAPEAWAQLTEADPAPDIFVLELPWDMQHLCDLVRHVRMHPRLAQLPILAMTSSVGDVVQREARDAGVDSLLIKPFSSKALLRDISRLLGDEGGMANGVLRSA